METTAEITQSFSKTTLLTQLRVTVQLFSETKAQTPRMTASRPLGSPPTRLRELALFLNRPLMLSTLPI
jgi:hypothetical protein